MKIRTERRLMQIAGLVGIVATVFALVRVLSGLQDTTNWILLAGVWAFAVLYFVWAGRAVQRWKAGAVRCRTCGGYLRRHSADVARCLWCGTYYGIERRQK